MKAFLKKAWLTLSRPSVHISLGVLALGGFVAGIIFWGGFNTALEKTNTEEFCVSCHADNIVPEYVNTIHDKNRSGVRATCPDCHVPHDWTDKISRKIQASKEVFAHFMALLIPLKSLKIAVLFSLSMNGNALKPMVHRNVVTVTIIKAWILKKCHLLLAYK